MHREIKVHGCLADFGHRFGHFGHVVARRCLVCSRRLRGWPRPAQLPVPLPEQHRTTAAPSTGGTFLDFDPHAMRAYFRQEFEKAKVVVDRMRKEEGKGSGTWNA